MMLMKMLMTLAMLMLMPMMMIMMSPHDQIYRHFRQMEHQLQLLLEQCAAQPPPKSEAQAELACPHCDQMLASDNTLRIHMGLHHVQARSMLSGDSPVVNCGKKFTKWQCPQHHIHGQPHNKIGESVHRGPCLKPAAQTLSRGGQPQSLRYSAVEASPSHSDTQSWKPAPVTQKQSLRHSAVEASPSHSDTQPWKPAPVTQTLS